MNKKTESQNFALLKLDHGDRVTIAEMVGTTNQYVYEVLSGNRSSESPKGKRIVEAAKSLQQTKRNLIELVKKNGESFSSDKRYMIPVNQPIFK